MELLTLAAPNATVYFAAGATPTVRAVQEVAPQRERAADLLARIFDRPDDLHVRYRATKLTPKGAATKRDVLRAFAKLDPKRPAIVFGAGHGAKATDTTPATIELWGPDDRMDAKEIATSLVRRKKPTAFVLGHCHSGAFMDLAYVGADPKKAIRNPARCVFAAVPADREASGCTADVTDPSAPAYLAQFAKALTSKTADYDKDGTVSLDEAHAFATIEDRTIDVPVRTSEQFVADELGDRSPEPTAYALTALKKGASPAERAVLERTLPFTPKRVADVQKKLDALDRRIEAGVRSLERAVDDKERYRRRIVDSVLLEWPELANRYHPKARALLAGDAKQVVDHIAKNPGLKRFQGAETRIVVEDRKLSKLEREAARLERWLRVARYVASKMVIERGRDERAKKGLASLVACERLAPTQP